MYRLNQQRLNLYRMVPKVMVVVLRGAVLVAVLLREVLIRVMLSLVFLIHKLLAIGKSAAFASNRYVWVNLDDDRVFWDHDFYRGDGFC